ncbi:FtsX-like permease family protein [Streptomyces sp. V4-01]|uniref:FtsX-like permease family protein n=1 Tax=Actinacidiphila polyblastidii TaxID=3110430 RepID=A0ABU7P8C1_9ACTN|nr:FtsX-like permease family protein [Streptomyces sp. V4-01]
MTDEQNPERGTEHGPGREPGPEAAADAGREAAGPEAEGGRGGLAWVRVRLRTAPAAALALFALVLATAFLAAALPRGVDRYENHALRESLRHADLRERGVTLLDSYEPDPLEQTSLDPVGSDQVERTFQSLVRPPLSLLKGQAVYGVRTAGEAKVPDPGLARTSPNDPAASLIAQAGLAGHVRVVAGRLPQPAAPPQEGERPRTVEGVVTEKTAQVLHLKVGQTVHLSQLSPVPLPVRVSGIVAPLDPASPWWNEDPDLLHPLVHAPPPPPGEAPQTYWYFTVLVDRTTAMTFPVLGGGISLYWHHPMDVDRLSAHQVPALQKELSSFDSGPDSVALQRRTGTPVAVGGSASTLLGAFSRDRAAASPLVLVAAVGVGTTAFAVLLMAGGLAADRRRVEISLLRSRGGSLRGIARRLAAETAAAAVPGGVLGTALALLLLPTDRAATAVALGALVTVIAVLALPLRAAWTVRRPRPASREDLAAARPSRRRLVLELTVTVLVAGAVAALRQRGTDGGDDPYLAAAPVLVAVAAALVLLRLYPMPLRVLARPAARLSGAVTHLGLARAGRSPATAQLPLLALLVSLTVASFGGSVLAGIDHGRDRAAAATVGADARIDARFALSPQLAAQVRKVPGVGRLVTVRVEPNGPTPPFDSTYSVVIVDPASYAAITRAAGLPAFPAAAYARWDGHGPLPAVVSPDLARRMAGRPTQITTGVGAVEISAAATLPATPAAPGAAFMIVSAAQLHRVHPDMAAYDQYTEPTTLLAMNAPGAHIDGPALHKAARESTTYVTVLLRGEQRAALTDTPLQHGARDIYLAAVAAGAVYSALALLLSLLQAAPQRTTLLARLRTMGMTRAQSQRLVLLEMLPQVLLAAVGGVLVGLAVIPLLGPGVDLRALTFGSGPQDLAPVDFGLGLHADPWSLALPSAGLLVLACAVLLVQAWIGARRRESTELRVGDRV